MNTHIHTHTHVQTHTCTHTHTHTHAHTRTHRWKRWIEPTRAGFFWCGGVTEHAIKMESFEVDELPLCRYCDNKPCTRMCACKGHVTLRCKYNRCQTCCERQQQEDGHTCPGHRRLELDREASKKRPIAERRENIEVSMLSPPAKREIRKSERMPKPPREDGFEYGEFEGALQEIEERQAQAMWTLLRMRCMRMI
jgi:hypothetical protein